MTKTKVDVQSSPSQLSASPKERRLLLLRHKMENGGGTGSSEHGQTQQHHAPRPPPDPSGSVQAAAAAAAEGEDEGVLGLGEISSSSSISSSSNKKKKKINRAPSPARPKDVPGWSLTKIRGGIAAPTLSVKPGAIHLGGRASRRHPAGPGGGGKESKQPPPTERHGAGRQAGRGAPAKGHKSAHPPPSTPTRRKTSDASVGSDDLSSRDSGCAAEKLSPTDSSSELSDCASDGTKLSTDAASSDAESRSGCSGGGGAEGERPGGGGGVRDGGVFFSQAGRSATVDKERLSSEMTGEESASSPGEERSLDSRVPASSSLAFSDLTEELLADGVQEELVREIEELRSENDYLKDEMEELRSEMLEMRDMYLEEDVYQLQELRQQLEQANKTCRILQYRLRKAERRSVRVAQTGQVDGELIRTLEQDVKVAKDVSIRVHSELDSVEKKRSRLEQENEELRVRLQDMEVAKQVLQQEMDKNPQKKRSARPNNKPEKKLCPQEDSADLKCQLHFAKEESALMCKKLTRLVKDSEAMKEELAKYRSLYGDVNASLTVEEVADSPHTREAEVRVHLKLVEEEANLLSRRIVELEVENRGLRAEMDDMKGPQDEHPDFTGLNGNMGAGLVLGGGAMVIGGGASSENVMELQRHLQFVEEEAELLRRSLIELEEQNKLLMNEINRYKSELPPPALASNPLGSSLTDGMLGDTIQEGAELISTEATPQEEEMREARLQIGDLNGKVKKLQYENRVLLSNLQRCDLASCHSPSSSSASAPALPLLALETRAPAGDSADCLPTSPLQREGPVGGENDHLETLDKKSKQVDNPSTATSLPVCLRLKDHDALLAMREQARLVSMAIQLLTLPTESNCLSPSSLYHMVCQEGQAGSCDQEKPQNQMSELSDLAERPLVGALTSRLQALHSQLQVFVERVDSLGGSPVGDRDPQVEGASPQTLLPEGSGSALGGSPSQPPLCPADSQDKKPDSSGQTECKVKGQEEETSQSDQAEHNQEVNRTAHQEKQPDETLAGQCSAGGLIETRPGLQGPAAEGEPKKRRPAATDHALQLSQLREHHQKALLRRDFQLQSVGLQARLQHRLWRQERTLLVQESQHLKQSLLLTSVKLRCFLQHWRLGHKLAADGRDILEVNSLKELYLLLEEEKQLTSPAHFQAAAEEQPRSPTIKWGGVGSTLADLRGALQGLSGELRLERQGSQELTQQFARAKASWEVERNELKSLITQLENKTGKAPNNLSSTEALDPPDLKVALKREREEHQHLLAESYAAVMDLTKQLQIGERNWSREKMELVETLGQERAQWEQRGGEELKLQAKSKAGSGCDGEGTVDSAPNGSSPVRAKSMSELQNPEINGLTSQEERSLFTAPALFLIRSELGDITGKNWSYLTNETPEVADSSKTWDGPTGPESELDPESVQKSFTAPDRTGIRIYYSPPAARRMAHLAQHRAGSKPPQQPHNGSLESTGLGLLEPLDLVQPYSSSYEQWLSSLSTPHRDPLESRGASSSAVSTNGAMADGAMDSSSSSSSSSGSSASSSSSSSFRGLEMGDISVNLSDDMKEMTNCVRQAIRSSSLERKSTKEPGSQMAGMATRSTQTATQCTSVGLQTESVSVGRGAGLHSKAWSPRHSSAATSSLASARSRQISTSLDKVHSRIDRPCCSPKYGSPKLQRRVSTGSTPRLTDGGPSRDRSLWSLQQRPLGGGGSAWARSTTTRDSPVLSGLNDGLSSLFSVVEHSGSMESLWRGEAAGSGTASRHPLAAGRPSGAPACASDAAPQRYGGLVQEFLRDVCSGRGQAGVSMSGERPARDSVDEPKPECVMSGAGGPEASDNVTRIVNKRFMRHAEVPCVTLAAASGTEDAACDCAGQSLSTCLARPSRSATRHSLAHCKHRPQESPAVNEERPDSCNE